MSVRVLLPLLLALVGGVLLRPALSQIQALPAYTSGTEFDSSRVKGVDWPTIDPNLPSVVETPGQAIVRTSANLPLQASVHGNDATPSFDMASPIEAASPSRVQQVTFLDGVSHHHSRNCGYYWQVLPAGLMYKSYLAGNLEPRFKSIWFREKDLGSLWDVALGGRLAMIRYGTNNALHPEGFQVDIEGAAFPRLDLEHERDVVATDFRFGVPLTFQRGRWQGKLAYNHISSHLGDEYMVRHQTLDRLNYVRDSVVLGVGFFPTPNLRLYSEADWAFITDGGAQPWLFQFGVDYSPARPTGFRGAPFAAVNGMIRQANEYGGNVTFQTGWQWRGETGHLLRAGFHYFNGKSNQAQFFNEHEEQVGIGLWYDN